MLRKEISGYHYYEKREGLHILMDEIEVPIEEAVQRGPRHLSLMLTRDCNLNCPFCYVQKENREATYDFLLRICEAAKELQVLDITLGGGEPTLYSSFANFISEAWSTYDFGLSVTTNAIDIAPLLDVAGMLSSVRVSIDNKFRFLDSKFENRIAQLSKVHKVGINLLCSGGTANWLHQAIPKLSSLGATDFLLIPEHNAGQYILSIDDWKELDTTIARIENEYNILITSEMATKVTSNVLDTFREHEYLFAHIDESGNLRKRSWGSSHGFVRTIDEIVNGLQTLNPLRRRTNESLV